MKVEEINKYIIEGMNVPFSKMRFMNEKVENRLIMEDAYGNKVEILYRPGTYDQAVDLGMKKLSEMDR